MVARGDSRRHVLSHRTCRTTEAFFVGQGDMKEPHAHEGLEHCVQKEARPLREVPSASDVMKILGAVYDVGRPTASWLNSVLQTLSSSLDRGGVAGVLYHIPRGGGLRIDAMDGINLSPAWVQAGHEVHCDPRLVPWIAATYQSRLVTTLSELSGDPRGKRIYRSQYSERHGVGDWMLINGLDASGKGCVLNVFSEGPLTLPDAQRDLFSRLATHLATGYRLHRQLGGGELAASAGAEAVLTPDGRIEHAEAGAKSARARAELSAAVRQRERTLRPNARDAERSVRSLKGLVDARWTLVDQYESGGRRYVLARENAPKPLGAPRLSIRERQVVALATLGRSNKLIAYELGLAFSTVRVLMARASAKLGATNRADLIARHVSARPH
jgi:DNA-binding NarL/FixJ family response regulator